MIHEMYMAATKENALKAYDHFVKVFEPKYPKAVECLRKDKEDLFTFYDLCKALHNTISQLPTGFILEPPIQLNLPLLLSD